MRFVASLIVATTMVFAALPALSADRVRVTELFDALGMDQVLDIMRREGITYGAEMEAQMFPGGGGPRWMSLVDGIYDTDLMTETMIGGMTERLETDEVDVLLDFMRSERGQRIVALEISARDAMSDEAVEEAAIAAYEDLADEGGPRWDQLQRFAEANDLIEQNVMGGMNANYAFYLGLLEGDAFPGDLTEDQILSDVWSQEADIRADSVDWVFAFLTLAYRPLSDDDLEAYIALSQTGEGRALNSALFGAFDDMFTGISRAMGLAASQFVGAQDI
ncbi:MAG: hypothetical protein AAFR35_07690 [Pseudomonadota bacterium]